MVIREAVGIANGAVTFEDDSAEKMPEPEPATETASIKSARELYQTGKKLLMTETEVRDVGKAVRCLTASAEQGNQYAQYALGKLYLLGKDVPQDKETALRWLEKSAAQGNIYAQFFVDHASDHAEPSALLSATRLLHHLGGIFRDNALPPGNAKGIRIDSKRRRKLHEMKVAAGHAEDEHDSEYTQIMSY